MPGRLRENGLAQTMLLLRHQASEDVGAWQLLRDWLDDGSPATLCLARLLSHPDLGQRPAEALRIRRTANYGLASRLALAEAQRLKRSAQAVAEQDVLVTSPNVEPHPPHADLPPPLHEENPSLVAPGAFQEHFGRYWRFAGVPARFGDEGKERDSYRSRHVAQVVAMAKASQANSSVHGALYLAAFERRKTWLQRLPASTALVQVRHRLLLGMGADTVHDTQLLLHPVTGMPYLPGSTLKGALRAWLQRLQNDHPGEQRLAATLTV